MRTYGKTRYRGSWTIMDKNGPKGALTPWAHPEKLMPSLRAGHRNSKEIDMIQGVANDKGTN